MVLSKLFNEYDYWIRCIIYINHHIRNALLDILHDNEHGLPRDPVELYKRLDEEYNKSVEAELVEERKKPEKKGKKSKKDEKPKMEDEFREYFDSVKNIIEGSLLMPSNNETDSQKWDNMVIVRMITIFRTDIPAPKKKHGWKCKKPAEEDYLEAPDGESYPPPGYIILARETRNLFFHSVICKMTHKEFKLKKEDIRKILVGLGYKDIQEFDEDDCLKTIDLANIRQLLSIDIGSVYLCNKCGIELNESDFKAVVDEIIVELNDYQRQDRKYENVKLCQLYIKIYIVQRNFQKFF